jgi:CRP/FNR family cyclic AMP-dependent transcriptional regulator
MNEKIIKSLRLVDVLAELPDDFIAHLARFAMLRTIRAGETIFCQGEPSPYCFGIVSGQITIQRVSKDRNFPPKTLSVLGAGAMFGEQALFKDSPRTAMALASQDGELVAIQGKQFRDWIEKDSAAGVPLLMSILQSSLIRLRQTSHELSLVYGMTRFLASDKPFAESMKETAEFLRSSLDGIDQIAIYQKNPFWEEFSLVAWAGLPEPIEALPLSDSLACQMVTLLRPQVGESQNQTTTALIPIVDRSSPSQPLIGAIQATTQNRAVFSAKFLMLLEAVAAQAADALTRHVRSDDREAQDRLSKSRQTYHA